METHELIANYSPIGDISSAICCCVLLFVIAKVLFFANDSKFTYLKGSLHLIMFGSLANIIFTFVVHHFPENIVAIFLLRDIYHICLSFCMYCFILYMKEMLDVNGKYVEAATYFTRVFFVICLVMDLLSPLTRVGLHLHNGLWDDPIINPYNIFYSYGVIIFLVMLLFYSKRIIRSLRICLIMTEIAVASVMTFQGLHNMNSMTTYTYVLPVLVVMILLHSRPFDDRTGALDAGSFDSYVKQQARKGVSMDYMILRLDLNIINKLPNELGKTLNSFWHRYFRDALLFNLDSNVYVLAIPRDGKNANQEEKIRSLMLNVFPDYYLKYTIPYKVFALFDIDFIEDESDMAGIIKYMLVKLDDNGAVLVDEKQRAELCMLKKIRAALIDIEKQGNLDDERVKVFCQPIRNMRTGRFDTGEALMRLELPDVGFVMPGMFITIAEQYGHIHSLTKIMLNKTCKEIKRLEEEGFDFERISVNFAASEIKAEDFCEEVLGIIRANNIAPSKIGIELTESQNESDFRIVKDRIGVLRSMGMTVYLDDVGTGYSNLDRIVRYDVDVVKFDRFFLLEAQNNRRIIKMISHLSEAFRDLNYKLLYEGVETDDDEEICVSCGADYIQGFKYSKPIPIADVRKYFEKA